MKKRVQLRRITASNRYSSAVKEQCRLLVDHYSCPFEPHFYSFSHKLRNILTSLFVFVLSSASAPSGCSLCPVPF
jgi:hypothetical protein